MNTLGLALKTPWIASPRSSRWLALVVMVLCAVSAALAAHGLDGRSRLLICGLLWGMAIGVWWLLVAGNALFVARDARILRLPSLGHVANASVVVMAALTVWLPALLLAAVLGHALAWLVVFSLAAVLCMLFLLLPSGLAVIAIIAGSAALNLLHPRLPPAHELLPLGALATCALFAPAAWQWFRLQRREAPATLGYGVPLIWSLRLQAIHGFGMRSANQDMIMARASATWLAPTPDLHGLGPARPVRSLRVALGRTVMPQTWASVLRQISLSCTLIIVFTVLPLGAQMHNHDFRAVMQALILPHAGALGMPVIIACVIGALAVLIFPVPVRARWSQASAELPLLALLPGLGDAADARRHVVRAALAQTARVCVIEFVILCGLAAWARVLPQALPLSALTVACTAALAAACILGELAARPISRLVLGAVGCVLLAVVGIAMGVGFSASGFDPRTWLPLAAALVLLLALLLGFCWRGWHAYARRAHPFLLGAHR